MSKTIKKYSIFLSIFVLFVGSDAYGNVSIKYDPPVNVIEKALLSDIKQSFIINKALGLINEKLVLSKPLTIVFGETPNNALVNGPYYSNGKISIPYLYVFQLRKTLNKRRHIHKEKDIDSLVFSSLVWALYHEVGHALIDFYGLPIAGLEENVVDNFANVLLLSSVDGGDDMLLFAASVMNVKSKTAKRVSQVQLMGKHRLNKQRYYTMLCHYMGSAATRSIPSHLPALSDSRKKTCAREYRRVKNGWRFLLNSIGISLP